MSGPRPLDAAWRLVFRLGFPLARVWWRLRGARPEGALVAIYVDRASSRSCVPHIRSSGLSRAAV